MLGLCRAFFWAALLLPGQTPPEPAAPDAANAKPEQLAPYFPTPDTIVVKMLELGRLKAGENVEITVEAVADTTQ